MKITDLFAEITPHTTVLTPNRRLATRLRADYDAWQSGRSRAAWPTIDVLPLAAWFQRLWLALEDNLTTTETLPQCLTPWQTQLLWQAQIHSSQPEEPVLRVASIAAQVGQAWQLMQQWQLSWAQCHDPAHADVAAFTRWAQAFEAQCKTNAWLPEGQIPAYLSTRLHDIAEITQRDYYLYALTEMTPDVQRLVSTASKQGAKLTTIAPAVVSERSCHRLAFTDFAEELKYAALWAKKALDEDADTTIAVVVPNLSAVRAQVLQAFIAVLHPETVLANHCESALSFNLSGGVPLAEVPVVQAACSVLAMGKGAVTYDILFGLLFSPYLGGFEQEQHARALWDVFFREHCARDLSSTELLEQCRDALPLLHQVITAYATIEMPERALPSTWAHCFSQQLMALGWPGDRVLSSYEYQAVQQWNRLLSDFARCDSVLGMIELGYALLLLEQHAQRSLFQAETENRRLQILGVLEAAGLSFDKLWLLGLSDEVWPPPANPTPFLPLTMQRQQGMPHADAARELAFAQRLQGELSTAAKTVIMSYAMQEGDRGVLPSPLIKAVTPLSQEALALDPVCEPLLMPLAALEHIVDETAPLLSLDDPIAGGSDVLKQQAACPFRAFARYRLKARALPLLPDLWDPRLRGLMLHSALQLIWQTLESHEALLALSCQEITAQVKASVQQAVQYHVRSHLAAQAAGLPHFLRVEQERLCTLLEKWLQFEKARSPFVVLACEQKQVVRIGPLTLRVAIDRIDHIAGERTVLIDYKTGQTAFAACLGERPDEPQLPLYCVTHDKPVHGIAFASVRADGLVFKGATSVSDDLPAVKAVSQQKHPELPESWQALKDTWRRVLETLAHEFAEGWAPVAPKSTASCQYCEFGSLCRVHEQAEASTS